MPSSMRLSKDLIQHLAEAVAANLETRGIVTYDAPRSAVAAKIADIITANMMEEERLNKDVEKLLSAHEAEIARGQMDYRKVFEMTKQKLAKDRGFVL